MLYKSGLFSLVSSSVRIPIDLVFLLTSFAPLIRDRANNVEGIDEIGIDEIGIGTRAESTEVEAVKACSCGEAFVSVDGAVG